MMMVLLLAAVELDPRSRRLTRYMAVLVVYLIMIFGYIIIWQIVFSVLCFALGEYLDGAHLPRIV
jgi:hypothetical protein